ncbi:roadblock/LC7 domain-containing protein [Dactylosporangium sp. NBC_01737]|uniref:roadblock/LC7 domain-containing protein n=1 Tax=Dactylosporangium sp. NBC_01737 TaxID=2975959 RepID=UPI002E0EC2BD|nr:roadblock/LC7 domain-containing protein [Dactylosporangium sp. NBC_01737]
MTSAHADISALIPAPADRQAELGWVLDGLLNAQRDVRHAVAVSADGMLVARTAGIDPADAERLAATVAGMASLTSGLCRSFAGEAVIHTAVTMVGGMALIIGIPGPAAGSLAVLTTANPDIGAVGYACAELVKKLGAALSVPPAAGVPGSRAHR